jgi:hypothetical protein
MAPDVADSSNAPERPDSAPSLLLIEFFGLRQLECLVASAELHISNLVVVESNA